MTRVWTRNYRNLNRCYKCGRFCNVFRIDENSFWTLCKCGHGQTYNELNNQLVPKGMEAV